ncbi:hypothetical protein DPMN_053490 [Dreissena polymorpha]|uniref:Uncharacterized protein n=1 Tax=Dreissena polymorpha TaxID=45954 RepID=A0A9D4CNV8_DREPO|nr:hypothetical protein DPMN_053490 [Dreissena polymorpha]
MSLQLPGVTEEEKNCVIGGFGDSENDVTFAHAEILAVKTAAILLLFACDEPHRDKVTIIFATLLKNKKNSELEIISD